MVRVRTLRVVSALFTLALVAACGASPDPDSGGGGGGGGGGTVDQGPDFPAHDPKGVQTPLYSGSGEATLKKGVLPWDEAFWANKTVNAEGTIVFNKGDVASVAFLKPGLVLAVPIGEGGDIRKVTAAEDEGGKRVVTTAPADITDYVESADMTIVVGGDAKADLTNPWIDVDLSGKSLADKSGGSWGVKLEIDKGRIAGNPRFSTDVVVSVGKLHLFQVTTSGFFLVQADLKLSGKGDKSVDKTIEIPLVEKEIVVMVGLMPVWVTPYVKLEVKGEANIAAEGEVTAGFKASLPGTFQLRWSREASPHWSTTSSGKVGLFPKPVKVSKAEVAGDAELTITASIGVKLYKRVTGELSAAAGAKAEVKVASGCTYKLSASCKGAATVRLDGFGPIPEKEATQELFDVDKTLTEGTCGGAPIDAASDAASDAGSDTGGGGEYKGTTGCATPTKPCDQGPMDCCAKAAWAAFQDTNKGCLATYNAAKKAAGSLPDAEKKKANAEANIAKTLCSAQASATLERARATCMGNAKCTFGSLAGSNATGPEHWEVRALCHLHIAECGVAVIKGADPGSAVDGNGVACGMNLATCVSNGGPGGS